MVSTLYAALFYVAASVLMIGLAARLRRYASIPVPLLIPTTPAPTTRLGVAARLAREVVLFESLFKANTWTWVFGWMFHAALLVVAMRHVRYVTQPVWGWVVLVQPYGIAAGFALVAGLVGLWARRILVPRIRYISAPSDHLMLALLVGLGGSGLLMTYVAHTDIVALKGFTLGLLRLEIRPLPADPLLLLHLALVIVLMLIFPFSKLLHGPGLFFSPTRTQVDNPRQRRYRPQSAARPLPLGRTE